MVDKHGLDFYVLSDAGLEVARRFGLDYRLSPELIKVYEGYGVDLKEYNGNEDFELPVPGYYVIDREGIIRWAYANEDYKIRPDPDDIVAALKKLDSR